MYKKRKIYVTVIAVAVIIISAIACHSISRRTDSAALRTTLDFTRTFLYVALFFAWGLSVRRRVIQKRIRRYHIAVSALTVFWLVLREFKFRFAADADLLRHMWYAYYIPILFIPLIALLVSIYLGKNDFKRYKAIEITLYSISVLLIMLVLTNDIHGFVFSFPPDEPVKSEYVNYTYGAGFFIIAAWGIMCSVFAIVIMVIKSRIPKTNRFLWLPLLPFGAAVIYIILYALRVPSLIMGEIDDLAVFDCLVFIGFFESSIDCGLIQSNARYNDLFRASGDLSVGIADKDYNVVFGTGSSVKIEKNEMIRAESGSFVTEEKKIVRNMPISGGHVVWYEDISELLELEETLEDRKDELRERNALLKYEYEKEKNHKTIVEQNRLYEITEQKTGKQIEKIENLIECYGKTEDNAEKRRILSMILVLGSYIKRSKDFALTLDSESMISCDRLAGAFSESFRALSSLGIRGGTFIERDKDDIKGDVLVRAYDFFEDAVESFYEQARFINISVCRVEGVLRISISTDCEKDVGSLRTKYPDMRVCDEDDGMMLILPLERRG